MKTFGILNITPDSFSDGGKFFEYENAILHAKELAKKCDVIDIGAQSTRPNAPIISYEEEILRLKNIIADVSKIAKVSIDSFNYETQKLAIESGALFVNDVSAFQKNKEIFKYALPETRFVFMHHLTIPSNKTILMPANGLDMINEIKQWAKEKIEEFALHGIEKSRLIFDVGIGFGKSAKQDIFLIENAQEFLSLDIEIMFGHSRKSFMEEIKKNATIEEKDIITQDITKNLAKKGINWVRVHKV